MNRREFCQHLALLAAGAAAMPAQIAAFEQLYEVNTRQFGRERGIVSIKGFTFGFDGPPCDLAACVTFFDGDRVLQPFVLNTRGMMHMGIVPDCPMFATRDRLRWEVSDSAGFYDGLGGCYASDHLNGFIRYIDMDGVIHNVPINGKVRHL